MISGNHAICGAVLNNSAYFIYSDKKSGIIVYIHFAIDVASADKSLILTCQNTNTGMSRSRCGIHLDIQIPYLACLLNITEKSDIITGSLYSKAPDCMSLSKKNPAKGRNQRNSFACKIKVCIQNYHFIL